MLTLIYAESNCIWIPDKDGILGNWPVGSSPSRFMEPLQKCVPKPRCMFGTDIFSTYRSNILASCTIDKTHAHKEGLNFPQEREPMKTHDYIAKGREGFNTTIKASRDPEVPPHHNCITLAATSLSMSGKDPKGPPKTVP